MDGLTTNQELYCQARVRGLTQRAAYREAYPRSAKWKDACVDVNACKLEANAKITLRIDALTKEAAKAARITRGGLLSRLDGLAEASWEEIERDRSEGRRIAQTAASALVSATRELLPYAIDERAEAGEFVADFGLLIAPDFLAPHRMIAERSHADYWAMGGRGSAKSSWASFEVVNHIERNPQEHALVLMKYKVSIREAVYAQIVWAITMLGLADEYEMPDSTFRIRKKSTGQLILFRGCDNPKKIKSVKVPFGHIGIAWYEEADMFRGMAEIRTVNQSITRGGPGCVRIYTFNPPRSLRSWANVEMQKREDAGLPVFRSSYLNVPREWLGDQFIADAEELRQTDERTYNHEYLGQTVGDGTEVFDDVEFREITDEEIAAFDNPRWGQDFGWYPDPWAVTASEWRPASNTILTFKELGGNKITPDEQARQIIAALTYRDGPEPDRKPVYHHIPVLSDDADPTTIAQQRDAGVNTRAAGKGNMRAASYRFLQSCHWVIDPKRCPHLAQEVREMQHEINRDGEVLNTIPDGNDHWVDASRYAFMAEARSRYAYRKGEATRGAS